MLSLLKFNLYYLCTRIHGLSLSKEYVLYSYFARGEDLCFIVRTTKLVGCVIHGRVIGCTILNFIKNSAAHVFLNFLVKKSNHTLCTN